MMSNCAICGGDLIESAKLDALWKCPVCGFICANMELSIDELERLYSEKYFNGEEYTDYLSDKELHKKNFARRWNRFNKIVKNPEDYSVLEIGCAYGLFLDTIKNQVSILKGIDISKDAIVYARSSLLNKAEIVQGDYLQLPTHQEMYDLVCMWDTIEHLSKPSEYIEKIASEVKSGGYVCITTGDIGSLNARLRGKKWRQIHPPTHLFYFSKKTLTMLLEKNGFSVIDISYPGNELSIRNIFYSILSLRMKKDRLYQKVKNLRIMDGVIYINLHDYIYVIARKN